MTAIDGVFWLVGFGVVGALVLTGIVSAIWVVLLYARDNPEIAWVLRFALVFVLGLGVGWWWL
jgi:hypothetical protein